jgi:transcriptional regulator with XRE-family HTH domain
VKIIHFNDNKPFANICLKQLERKKMATFGQRFQQLREASNLNQDQLAKQFSVDHSTISKWEGDKAVPGTAVVIKIANYFNVSTDFLLGVEDESFEGSFWKILRENRDVMNEDEQQFLLEMVGVYFKILKNRKGREINQEN